MSMKAKRRREHRCGNSRFRAFQVRALFLALEIAYQAQQADAM
jgi:hypothetical protein